MKTLIPVNVIDDYLEKIEVRDLNKASIRQVLACELNAEKVTGQEFIHFEMGVPGIPPSAVGIKAQKEALDRGVIDTAVELMYLAAFFQNGNEYAGR